MFWSTVLWFIFHNKTPDVLIWFIFEVLLSFYLFALSPSLFWIHLRAKVLKLPTLICLQAASLNLNSIKIQMKIETWKNTGKHKVLFIILPLNQFSPNSPFVRSITEVGHLFALWLPLILIQFRIVIFAFLFFLLFHLKQFLKIVSLTRALLFSDLCHIKAESRRCSTNIHEKIFILLFSSLPLPGFLDLLQTSTNSQPAWM